MAVNPKQFSGATPQSHSGKIDKSGSSRTNWSTPKSNGERGDVSATSMSHYKPVPKSGSGHGGLGNKSIEMGAPYAMSSDRSEMKSGMAMPSATKKSKPGVAAAPVKWHKRGYKMDAMPMTTTSQGQAFASKMKAK